MQTNLTVSPEITKSQTISLCTGQSITVGTHTYNTTGVYTDVLTSAGGCDSTVTTNLTVSNGFTKSQAVSLCTGKSIKVGTNTYNTTGVYNDVLKSVDGCDSTVTTNLTVSNGITNTQTISLCSGESIKVGTHTYNTTGIYTDVITSSGGCDSTITTNLTVNKPIDVGTDVSSGTITSKTSGANYKCYSLLNKKVKFRLNLPFTLEMIPFTPETIPLTPNLLPFVPLDPFFLVRIIKPYIFALSKFS